MQPVAPFGENANKTLQGIKTHLRRDPGVAENPGWKR